jgi:hypothetical protein
LKLKSSLLRGEECELRKVTDKQVFLLSSVGRGVMLLLYSFKLPRISKLEKSVYVNVRERDSERGQEEVNHSFF